MSNSGEQIESLVRDLPDREGARLFYERLATEHSRVSRTLARDAGLLSDLITLAAWSPLLATTILQNPDYISWLARERTHTRLVRTREEFGESLARFALTNSQLDPQVLIARFRRRELLRIYLNDIRRTNTIVETTEELSNLADAALEYALNIARQDLDNRYGQPLRTDERGRKSAATFSVIALGKLGSLELNYASDIDLLFIYSDDGTTSSAGTGGSVTNREYFNKLAELVARIVGKPSGEGAAYRVDLRLRPHGRDGPLSTSLEEAVRYYRETAHAWELQALIRARSAAGDASLFARFAERVRSRVYRPDQTVARALAEVRLAKQKIDRQHAHDAGGFNVKLGRGGIREIEFIAQALQLAFGGRDEWLRAPHTLISLGRLADRHHITERERTELSDAYTFLRALEHRLQMEHGLQTHSMPDDEPRRALLARRMNFTGEHALEDFNRALELHTNHVRAAFDRVFKNADDERTTHTASSDTSESFQSHESHPENAEQTAIDFAASVFAARASKDEAKDKSATCLVIPESFARLLNDAAQQTLNPRRALLFASRIAASLDKSPANLLITPESLSSLVQLCGVSEFFGEMLAGHPALVEALPAVADSHEDYRAQLSSAVESAETFRAELSALRREWSRLLLRIGALDASGAISMRESNRLQTKLAGASLDAAALIAERELARRYGELSAPFRLAVLGLGRLGGAGMDYGSDLDLVLIYDAAAPAPVRHLAHNEIYARFAELLVAALSSLTRAGSLYRVDLRLRPDGRNGQTASPARVFKDYLRERAVIWEWLAYVKLRAAAGDVEFGLTVEREAREIIHSAARHANQTELASETRRVRERLEHEKSTRRGRASNDIKYGTGGMLDVYFATRYMQLRDDVRDEGPDRSTTTMLRRLRAAGSLDGEDFTALNEGYQFLRTLDHNLRLIIGRSTRLPQKDHPALKDIAQRIGLPSSQDLIAELNMHMTKIRAAYDRITESKGEG